MKNFAITGAAGYVAPRHLKAIKETGNNLTAAMDPHDSVGLLDSFFPNASFFTEFERFERYIEMLRRKREEEHIHYISICSPNHLHDAHIRLSLRTGANAICEKPLVLNPWNLDALQQIEEETGKKVYNVLQLRIHPSIIELKEKIKSYNGRRHDVVLTYVTSRGLWYRYSWKGDNSKSGGIATNIGIHLFDLLMWLFGDIEESQVHLSQSDKMSGFLALRKANVRWYLSLDKNDLPESAMLKGHPTFRSIQLNGEELEFTNGFNDLHTRVYENILEGKGFGIEDARSSIETVYNIRNAKLSHNFEYVHPMMEQKINFLSKVS